MTDPRRFPPLKSLHSEGSLNAAKLTKFDCMATEVLVASLSLEEEGCLKARPDGTILDGHHRVHILRSRGIDVDGLPRDILEKDHE
jgi:hypothetical protein